MSVARVTLDSTERRAIRRANWGSKAMTLLTSTDHKVIANLYFVTTMAFFCIGGLLALIIRALCLDSHDELRTAWQALVENGFPPRATAAFEDVSLVGYSSACGNIRRALESPDRLDAVILQRELLVAFRRNYRLATHLARAGL